MKFTNTAIDNKHIVIVLIVFAVLSRFVPHPPNFTPVGALGLFAGAFLIDKRFWLVPIIALFASDFFIGFYQPISMIFVYCGFVLTALVGRLLLQQRQSILLIGSSAVISAAIFFILSNLGVWMSGSLYPVTFPGLIECYIAAIPFFGNTLAGDLSYSFALFGLYFLLHQRTAEGKAATI